MVGHAAVWSGEQSEDRSKARADGRRLMNLRCGQKAKPWRRERNEVGKGCANKNLATRRRWKSYESSRGGEGFGTELKGNNGAGRKINSGQVQKGRGDGRA